MPSAIDPLAYVEYYPFGKVLHEYQPHEPYRYGYQGDYAEKDEETGWNSFQARMYDPIIGRWLAVDPQRQYPSPYTGMGNNPVNKVDPDGEWAEDPDWIYNKESDTYFWDDEVTGGADFQNKYGGQFDQYAYVGTSTGSYNTPVLSDRFQAFLNEFQAACR